MLIFSKARLVVLSVPKTGTTAIEQALAGHASIAVLDPPELKHAPVYRYKPVLSVPWSRNSSARIWRSSP